MFSWLFVTLPALLFPMPTARQLEENYQRHKRDVVPTVGYRIYVEQCQERSTQV